MKRLFNRLNLVERVGLLLAVLYGTGVVALVQFSSLYWGFESIDFLRLKPILVGIQFYLYCLIPFATFCLPYILTARLTVNRFWRVLFGVVGMCAMLVAVALMFHYFLPCVQIADFYGFDFWAVPVVANFWRLFLGWSILAHLIVCVSLCVLLVKPRHLQRLPFLTVSHRTKIPSQVLFLLVGMVTLLFSFNRNLYMNISQSAGGGAPKAGILTLVNPTRVMTRANVFYANDEHEITKPCFLLDEDDDSILISEMFLEQERMKSLNERSILNSLSRIDKSHVAQFSPVSYFQMWHDGSALILTNSLPTDVLHHLELTVVAVLSPRKVKDSADRQAYFQVTNTPEVAFWLDDRGCVRAVADYVSFAPSANTNLVCHIKFSSMPCQSGIQIWQWEHLMTNAMTNIGMTITNFPRCPDGYVWRNAMAVFRCNFLCAVELPLEMTLEAEDRMVARKRKNDDNEVEARR